MLEAKVRSRQTPGRSLCRGKSILKDTKKAEKVEKAEEKDSVISFWSRAAMRLNGGFFWILLLRTSCRDAAKDFVLVFRWLLERTPTTTNSVNPFYPLQGARGKTGTRGKIYTP